MVYAKPPFGSPSHVLAYPGRYTHRVAIANSRLVDAGDETFTFRWRNYRHGNAARLMSLAADEFIRRFLLHSLPDGFHRIRHYGFMANGCRSARLAVIRELLAASPTTGSTKDRPVRMTVPRVTFDHPVCPCCGGRLLIVTTLSRQRTDAARASFDASTTRCSDVGLDRVPTHAEGRRGLPWPATSRIGSHRSATSTATNVAQDWVGFCWSRHASSDSVPPL